MRLRQVYLAVLFLFVISMAGQVRVIKPVKKSKPKSTRLAFFGGLSNSVLLLERNIREDNGANGFHIGTSYGITRVFRAGFEYTRYREIDIAPTWYEINAETFEVNVHALAKVNDINLFFYPLMGVSYNVFQGYFTGQEDYLNLARMYERNANVETQWFGANLGVGLEYFIKQFSLYGEFKMRIGETESGQVSIMDVCFSTGVRYNLRVPSLYKIFSGTRSRYLLDTRDSDF
jgi:hypothetical protein